MSAEGPTMPAVRLDLLHAKALRNALIRADYDGVPTERTVRRWITGEVPWPPSWQQATAKVLALPDTKKEPPPDWARVLPDEVAEAVLRRLSAPDSPLVSQLEDRLEQLGLLPAEGSPEEPVAPRGGSRTVPRLSVRPVAKR